MYMKHYATKRMMNAIKILGIPASLMGGCSAEIFRGMQGISLGRGLFKKRLRTVNAGKRGGYRVIWTPNSRLGCIYLFVYAKNQQENLTSGELDALGVFAKLVNRASLAQLTALIKCGDLKEVHWNEKV